MPTDDEGQPGRQRQRGEQSAAGRQLVQPGRLQIGRGGRDHDPIERSRLGVAATAVRVPQLDAARGEGVQVVPRLRQHLPVHVDRPHLPRPRHVGQQRRVVAGAGADLQHAAAGLRLQVLQHLRHQRRLARRADRHRRLGARAGRQARDERPVGVEQAQLRRAGVARRHLAPAAGAAQVLVDAMQKEVARRVPEGGDQVTATTAPRRRSVDRPLRRWPGWRQSSVVGP